MPNAQRKSPAIRRAVRGRWITWGAGINPEIADLRLALKREIYLRELTIAEVAKQLGMNHDFLARRLAPLRSNEQACIRPNLLARLIETLHITPAVARRLHLLAAQEAGWKV